MSRKFTLIRDYYDEGFNIYKNKDITIESGVTVLVGCNGIGKTTLLHQIRDSLKKDNIPCIEFDNLKDGGEHARSKAGFYGDFSFLGTAIQSSEGENIIMNMLNLAKTLGRFVQYGVNPDEERYNGLARTMRKANGEDVEADEIEIPKERWILLDAVDSGLSVDNIVDLKEQLFKTVLEHNFGNEIYIIVSANEYEMARGEQCFDVYNGKYLTFRDYEEYRNLVLQSKEWKRERSEE